MFKLNKLLFSISALRGDTIAGPPQLPVQSADDIAGRKTDEGSRLCKTAAG